MPPRKSANLVHLKRPPISTPRYEVVFGAKAGARSVLAELRALFERSGEVLGDAYASVAGSVLERVERLEDARAERKFRQSPRESGTALASNAQAKTRKETVPAV